MKVVIIGTGNTATVFAKRIIGAGHQLVQLFGRTPAHTSMLAGKLGSAFTSDIKLLDKSADIYIVAISDQSLYDLGSWLNLERKLVVHTAGSVLMNVLSPVSKNFGILYPLQSLRKEMSETIEIPILVDGNTPDDLALIRDFAITISSQVEQADDGKRVRIHLAAVLVSNFVNHLYALAEDYCRKEHLDFSILQPLIQQTAERVAYLSPLQSQTGPAVRKDLITINKHLDLLDPFPELRNLYQLLTTSIQETHYNK